jgi:hypothetical protein
MPSSETKIAEQFQQFQTAYKRQNYGLAADAFVDALRLNAGIAYRYFMARASAPISVSLRETGRASEVSDWLDKALADFPDVHLLVNHDPDVVRQMLDLRESHIANGLSSIVLVTQGKAASVSVASIFNSGFNLPSFAYSLGPLQVIESWAKDYARGGASYTTHLEPEANNLHRLKRAGLQKVIVHVRDPRQSLLSMIHHISSYPDQIPVLAQSEFPKLDVSRQISRLFPFYISLISWIQGWMNAQADLDILYSTFEDFTRDRKAFTERYLEFYAGNRKHFSWENATTQHPGTDYHFRAGFRDEWRTAFSRRDAEWLTAYLPATMRERFDWD